MWITDDNSETAHAVARYAPPPTLKREIVFNEQFLKRITETGKWLAYCVAGHEFGHLLRLYLENKSINVHDTEREANWALPTTTDRSNPVDSALSRLSSARERIARIGRGLDGRHGKLIAQSHGEANWAKSGSTRTVKSYSNALEHLAPRIGGKHVEEVTGKLIEEIVTARRHEGVTDATIKRKQVALSWVIDYAIDGGYTGGNPVLPRLKRIKEDRDPILLPGREDVEKVISRRYRHCTPAQDWSPRATPLSTVVAHGVSPPVPLS